PEGGLGFGAADYVPQEHKLITQFNGVETDSGSCLAFAPSVRGGPGNTVQPRDWQTPGRQSDNVPSEFIKLEPWAVPCANQWMKDNPNKWQGYSFYTWMTPLERCATVVYSLGLQPVLAFVGGLEFDLMPSPIAEVETFVCWPDTQPGGVDLSAIEMHIMSGGVPLLTRTIRLKKRFGSGTDFSNSNIHATTASGKANFGVPEDGADDSGLNGMSRDSLLQANASLGFEVEQENYLASMIYDDQLGANVTESLRGVAAARRLKALFPEKAEGLVETEEESNTEADDHVLFTLRSPGNGLVGFEIMGLLSDNKLQLSLQMQFGPFTTPRKRMTLIDLAQQLQIILGSIPFISVSSKAKAIQALHDFDTEAESSMPVSTDEGFGAFSTFWVIAGNGHREDQRGAMIYWTDSPRVYPFNHDVRATFRFFPDGEGEYWMVTSDSSDKPGKMVYLKDGGFHLHDFHEDPKTKWRMVEDGGQYWLVTGPNHHTPGKMMYLTDSGWSFWTFSPDPLCKFRLEPATGPTAFAIKPFMLNPAEVWIVTKEPHHGYENKMIFWKAGGTDVYNFNFAPESRWTLRSNGDGDYWLVTGSQSDSPGKMLYLKNNVFNVWNWNQDQKCLWRLVSSGGGGFWLATNPNHHTPNKMVYIANGVWNFVNFWEDPSTTYNVLLRG
ncbi:FCPA, partial [Symbiodinium pilosum]